MNNCVELTKSENSNAPKIMGHVNNNNTVISRLHKINGTLVSYSELQRIQVEIKYFE